MKKKLSVITIAICMVFSFCSCGTISEEDVIGTWSGTWSYNGNTVIEVVSVGNDHSYTRCDYVDGSIENIQTGQWEISGSKLILECENGSGSAIVGGKMKFSVNPEEGTMENGGHTLSK